MDILDKLLHLTEFIINKTILIYVATYVHTYRVYNAVVWICT